MHSANTVREGGSSQGGKGPGAVYTVRQALHTIILPPHHHSSSEVGSICSLPAVSPAINQGPPEAHTPRSTRVCGSAAISV